MQTPLPSSVIHNVAGLRVQCRTVKLFLALLLTCLASGCWSPFWGKHHFWNPSHAPAMTNVVATPPMPPMPPLSQTVVRASRALALNAPVSASIQRKSDHTEIVWSNVPEGNVQLSVALDSVDSFVPITGWKNHGEPVILLDFDTNAVRRFYGLRSQTMQDQN